MRRKHSSVIKEEDGHVLRSAFHCKVEGQNSKRTKKLKDISKRM